ncbi:MAG: hypothetical protein ABIA04_11895 [Pseudomonadota bacterium]
MKKLITTLLLISFILSSCMTSGGTSANQVIGDAAGSDEEWDWDEDDPFGGLEDYDDTDSDGDGVYDWIEEQMGTDPNDPTDVPDVAGALAYDASLDSSGMSNLTDYLGGALSTSMASVLTAWGLPKNIKTCITPRPTKIKGNLVTTDQKALKQSSFTINSLDIDTATETPTTGKLKFSGNLYYMLTKGTGDSNIQVGHYSVQAGIIIMKPMGFTTCVNTFAVDVAEIPCKPCEFTDTGVVEVFAEVFGDWACTQDLDNKKPGLYVGWEEPISNGSIQGIELTGVSAIDGNLYELTYINDKAGATDQECDEIRDDSTEVSAESLVEDQTSILELREISTPKI